MSKKNLSIITPILNGLTYVDDLVDSIVSQNDSRVEIIFVDGGSKDGSIEKILEHQNKHGDLIRYETFINPPGVKGIGGAWNQGARIAKGDILGWLGADDTSYPGAIDFVLSYFKANPTTMIMYGSCNIIDSNGNQRKKNPAVPISFNRFMSGQNPVSCPTTFYRKSVFDAVGGVDDYGNDFELFVKISQRYEVETVSQTLGQFRIHERSETGNVVSYINTLKLDADVITKYSGHFFSSFRWRYLTATCLSCVGLTRLIYWYKRFMNRN